MLPCKLAGVKWCVEVILTMQLEANRGAVRQDPQSQEFRVCCPPRYGWSMFDGSTPFDFDLARECPRAPAWPPHSKATESAPAVGVWLTSPGTAVGLLRDKTIAISVIRGRSKGLTRQFSQQRISIGRAGGEADLAIDDQGASPLHCAIDVTTEGIRLHDLDSANGTYVDDKQIRSMEIQHLSEFRIGSSLLLILILPKQERRAE